MIRDTVKVLRARALRVREAPRAGLTLDTGALIQLEKRSRRTVELLATALDDGVPLRIPAAAVAEFWRGSHGRGIEGLIEVATLADTRLIAQRAGEALAAIGKPRRGQESSTNITTISRPRPRAAEGRRAESGPRSPLRSGVRV